MAGGRDINVRLRVRDDGTVVLKRFGRQVDRTAARSERSLSRLTPTARGASRAVRDLATSFGLLGGAVGAAAFILPLTAAVRVTNALDVALAGVRAVSGATASQMAELEEQARRLGETTQFSAAQAAEAQEFLARAGFKVNEILEATPATLDLAAAGSLNLARAADIASNVLQGFQKEAGALDEVVDIMAATTANANSNVQQMGDAMSFVAPVAASFNVSIRETAAGIAVLSNAGLQGQRAGTGLRRVIVELAAPSGKLATAMGGLTLEGDGLVAVLKQLAGSTLTASDAMAIFGQRGGPAFNLLRAGAFSAERFAEMLDDVDGAARRIAETKLDNLSGDAREFGSAMAEVGIKIGRSGLLDDLRDLTQSLTELARGDTVASIARNLVPAIKELLGLLLALAAARLGARIFGAIAASATSAAGNINLLSNSLTSARGRFVLAGRAARGFGAALGLLGGPAGVALLAVYAVYRLVTAEDALSEASERVTKAQKNLNDELEATKEASQDTVIEATKAQREMVRLLQEQVAARRALGDGSIAGVEAAPAALLERLAEAEKRLKELEKQLGETAVALDAFGGAGPPLEDLLSDAADAVLEAETAMGRLEDATKRLGAQQERAIDDARNFARAQQEILQAQFNARAPGLGEDERVAEQRQLNDRLRQIQRDQLDEERRIAIRAAGERLFLLKATLSDEKQIGRGRIAIRQDLAAEELDIERRKFDLIKKELVDTLSEEQKLRAQAADARSFADDLERQLEDAGKSQSQLRNEAGLEAIQSTGQKAIDAWKRYVELGGDARQAIREIRREAEGLDKEADKVNERAAQLGDELKVSTQAIQDLQGEIRKLTENIDLQTAVKVDDSEFQAFLAELSKPTEHTVRINAEQGRKEGGPVLHARTGRRIPGYGGGDKVDVKAEAGEFVLRKEVGRATGFDFLYQLNRDPQGMLKAVRGMMRPPLYRQAGGPIGDIPGATSGSGRDQVDINLNLGGGPIRLSGDRDAARALTQALRGMQSSIPGGLK